MLSQNPEAEQKIAEELASQGLLATADNPHPRSLTWDDMGHLTYLKAAIKVGCDLPINLQYCTTPADVCLVARGTA